MRCIAARSAAARPRRAQLKVCAASSATTSIRSFVQDCTQLGQTRFIVIGDGAILESVSSFDRIAFNDVAGKGTYATISTPDKTFECHINLNRVQQVKLAKSKAKAGDYDLYATRFFNDEGKMIMSCILHGQQGSYSEAAVAHWEQLQQQYGSEFNVTAE